MMPTRSSTPIGCPVPGCNRGGVSGRSAARLYQVSGISLSRSSYLVCSCMSVSTDSSGAGRLVGGGLTGRPGVGQERSRGERGRSGEEPRVCGAETVEDLVVGKIVELAVRAQELHVAPAPLVVRVVQAVGGAVELQRGDPVQTAQPAVEHRSRRDPPVRR